MFHIVSNAYGGHRDSLSPASSKHEAMLHTLCPCKQALTRAQGYMQGYRHRYCLGILFDVFSVSILVIMLPEIWHIVNKKFF